MFVQDNQRKGYKVFREHSADIDQEWKASQFGLTVTGQSDQGGYSVENYGDESQWVYWEPQNPTGSYRKTGAWAQAWPVVVLAGNTVRPVLSTVAMTADTSFAVKTLVTISTGGLNTTVRCLTGSLPSVGDYGLVVSGSAHGSYELLFIPIGGGGTAFLKAKIHWDLDLESDRSEGELVTYNTTTDSYVDSGSAIWIDYDKSTACKFETMGNATVFAITLVESAVERFGVTRDLYSAVFCEQDAGSIISHLYKVSGNANYLTGYAVSENQGYPSTPWGNLNSAAIKTSILGTPKVNLILARVPKEWDLTGGNWQWTELHDLAHGQPFYFRPMTPVMLDHNQKLWQSEQQRSDTDPLPLSIYKRK